LTPSAHPDLTINCELCYVEIALVEGTASIARKRQEADPEDVAGRCIAPPRMFFRSRIHTQSLVRNLVMKAVANPSRVS